MSLRISLKTLRERDAASDHFTPTAQKKVHSVIQNSQRKNNRFFTIKRKIKQKYGYKENGRR